MRKALCLAGAVVLAASTALVLTPVPASAGATGTSGFVQTRTVTRDHVVGGRNEVVDTRHVTLRVNTTKNLRSRQEITVSWQGAHPTGGIVADQNSIDAQQEEYPVVLLECRGSASSVRPQTCWTQDWSERYQESYDTDFPAYRLDRYASAADRSAIANAPKQLPSGCFPAPVQHWVPFVAANGHVYADGPAGCAGQPPESQSVGGSAMPSNETFGVTAKNGRGSAKFDIWTDAENASLGCSLTVTCSLVAVPVMGISCDPAAKSLRAADRPTADELSDVTAACESKGNFAPGQLVTPQNGDALSVSGSLWWSASNWRNRIVVPLTFAVPDDACSVVHTSNDVDVYGSEVLVQATGQWAPHFCLNDKLFNFTHVQTGEPEARNLVATGGAEAAFTSNPQPNGYGKPVVQAPVAVSGFAITYVIDNANGQEYTKLRLTPRLLAKLLTESYPAELAVKQEYPALADNPLNITLDPEFIKLNPGIVQGVSASQAASTLLTLSSDSDVIRALTTYINDDPSARAWLNGAPDPSGMVVNPAYRHIKLPVDKWPLLSKFEPKTWYAQDLNDCLFHNPVPYLPLVAAPAASLADISEAMQFSIAQSTTTCSQIDGTSTGEKLVKAGRQTVGYRFMIGVTSLADAHRYELDTAGLRTTNGRFVIPDDTSLRAAAALLRPDKASGTWPVPTKAITTKPADAAAYPGTMVVYAAVPTIGLSGTDANDFAKLLRFAAGAGQRPGLDVGELPPGYLPMTTANGLGRLASYTEAAADAVAAQQGALPALVGRHPDHSAPGGTSAPPSSGPGGSSGGHGGTAPDPGNGSIGDPDGASVPDPAGGNSPGGTTTTPADGSTAPSGTAPTPTSSAAAQSVPLGQTPGSPLGGAALAVVIALLLAVVGMIATPASYLLARWRGKR
jgi:hypothetical protein